MDEVEAAYDVEVDVSMRRIRPSKSDSIDDCIMFYRSYDDERDCRGPLKVLSTATD